MRACEAAHVGAGRPYRKSFRRGSALGTKDLKQISVPREMRESALRVFFSEASKTAANFFDRRDQRGCTSDTRNQPTTSTA